MVLKGKLTADVEVGSHGHQVYEFISKKPHHISQISPGHIQGCQLLEGEFGKEGCIMYWNYTVDGKECVAKSMVEKLDDEQKIVVLKVLEGHLMEEYSSFRSTVQATEKEVKWMFEYERLNEDVPHPTKLLDSKLNVNKHIDEHHRKA